MPKRTPKKAPSVNATPKSSRTDLGSAELTCTTIIKETVANWKAAERKAWNAPKGREWPLVALITGYALLADTHRAESGVTLGNEESFADSAVDLMRGMLDAIWLGTGRLDNSNLQELLDDLAEHTNAQVGL